MTQEEKDLLLKDLCTRLSCEVKVDHFGTVKDLLGIMPSSENVMVGYDINDYEDSVIEDIKPYLRPMSSMTEEEKVQLSQYACIGEDLNGEFIDEVQRKDCAAYIDWLNKNHFDYRDLILKGLALEAPEGMYKI